MLLRPFVGDAGEGVFDVQPGINRCPTWDQHLGSLPETNSSHPKMDGWNTILFFSDGLFSGDMLVLGRVTPVVVLFEKTL